MANRIWISTTPDPYFASVSLLEHGEAWHTGDVGFAPITGQTLTRINSIAKTLAQSRFGEGSILFTRASSHALTAPNAANLQLGDLLTIEAQIRRAATGEAHTILSRGSGSTGWEFGVGSDDKLFATYGSTTFKSSATIPANVWRHVAWSRPELYVAGGYIYDVRGHTLNKVGNADKSSAQAKFGTYSLAFDGSGDCINFSQTDFDFGSGDFCIEQWVRHNSLGAYQNYYRTQGGGANAAFTLRLSSANQVEFFGLSSGGSTLFACASSASLAANTWYHVAGVRYGSSFKIYIDGTNDGSTTYAGALAAPQSAIWLGAFNNGGSEVLNGYLDEVRVTKGAARYTGNFTAPSSAFPQDSSDPLWDNVIFLCSAEPMPNSGENNSKIFIDGNLENTASENTAYADANVLNIGRDRASTNYFGGWMNDIRITKGVGRYSGTFTAPSARFPDISTITKAAPSPEIGLSGEKYYWHT